MMKNKYIRIMPASLVIALSLCTLSGATTLLPKIPEKNYTAFGTAPQAFGIRSLSDSGNWEYNQSIQELKEQSNELVMNAFKEIFIPENPLNLENLIDYEEIEPDQKEVSLTHNTGVGVLDSYEQEEFIGLTDTEINYLIQNNVLSRIPREISVSGGKVNISDLPSLYNRYGNQAIDKSDLLVLLHRASFGTIPSRPILVDIDAYREAKKITWTRTLDAFGNYTPWEKRTAELKMQKVNNTGKIIEEFYMDLGEYAVHLRNQDGEVDEHEAVYIFDSPDKLSITSPNIKELYILSYLQKGILNSNNLNPDYSSKNLVLQSSPTGNIQYSNYSKTQAGRGTGYPKWAPELGTYGNGQSQASGVVFEIPSDGIWGKDYQVRGTTITHKPQQFFNEESITTIEALKVVEAILRRTEADMSDREAAVVTYKYGADFVKQISESDHRTITYLTAKGILDFENFEEYSFLYSELPKKFAYTLAYRLKNEAARSSFSQIQLTDTEAFWVDQGFVGGSIEVKSMQLNEMRNLATGQNELIYNNNDTIPVPKENRVKATVQPTVRESEVRPLNMNAEEMIKQLQKGSPFQDSVALSDTENEEYLVTVQLPNVYEYTYKKKEIAEGVMPIDKAHLKLAKKSSSAHEELVSFIYKADTDSFELYFKIRTVSSSAAVHAIRANIAFKLDSIVESDYVNAISNYDDNGQPVTLISETEFTKVDSELTLLTDKILMNTRTGVKAILLPDKNLAIVGSEIVKANTIMIKSPQDELNYYNLDVLKILMSNGYLSTFANHALYTYEMIGDEYIPLHSSRGDLIGQAAVGKFSYLMEPPVYDNGQPSTLIQETGLFVNKAQLQSMSNSYTREITETASSGATVTIKIILDFVLSIPESDENKPNNKTATVGDVNKFIFTRPPDTNKELQEYWDMNLEMSNALMNGIMDTTKVQYITTGYLLPNITLLYYSEKSKSLITTQYGVDYEGMREVVAGFFQKVGEEFSPEFVMTFIGNQALYNRRVMTRDLATLDVNIYKDTEGRITHWSPKYNDTSQYYPQKQLTINYYPMWVHALLNNVQPEGTANRTLWRRNEIGRKYEDIPISQYQRDSMIFINKQKVYVIPANNAVYELLEQSPLRMVDKKVTLPTRTSLTSVSTDVVGSEVTFNSKKYYVAGIDTNYYVLISLEPTETNTRNTGKDINAVHLQQMELFKEGAGNYVSYPNQLPSRYYEEDQSYLIVNDTEKVIKTFRDDKEYGTKNIRIDQPQIIRYHHPIAINMLNYDIVDKEIIAKDKLLTTLVQDMFEGAFTRTHIDTLILDSMETIPLKEVEVGTIIEIADLKLLKVSENEYITAPIKLQSTLTNPVINNGVIDLDTVKTFTSTALNFPILQSGSITSFIDYISRVQIAEQVDHEDFYYNGTIVTTDSETLNVFSATDLELEQIRTDILTSSISLKLRIEDGLSVIKSDIDNTAKLIFSAVQPGLQKLKDAPIIVKAAISKFSPEHTENLESSNFYAPPNSHYLHNQEKAEHKKNLAQQILRDVCNILIVLGALRVMMTIIFKQNSQVGLYVWLRGKVINYDNPHSFDWVKLITIGGLDKNDSKSWGTILTESGIIILFVSAILIFMNRANLM